MKEEQFIENNKAYWMKLEEETRIAAKQSVAKMTAEELRNFLHLFRHTSHCLGYARTHFKGSKTEVYLNQLTGKAHNYIYVVPKNTFGGLKYLTRGFPKALRENKWYFWASFGIFMLGAILAFALIMINREYAFYFLPEYMVENLNLSEEIGWESWDYPILSSYVMTNNIRVSFLAFVAGLTFGIGTAYVLYVNGAMLGALTAVVLRSQASFMFYASMILPHGVLELTAIFISGAAGLLLGKNLLMPGRFNRRHALVYGGKRAVMLLPGVILMLIIAGLIEGFITPLHIPVGIKLFFALASFLGIIAYFYFLSSDTD